VLSQEVLNLAAFVTHSLLLRAASGVAASAPVAAFSGSEIINRPWQSDISESLAAVGAPYGILTPGKASIVEGGDRRVPTTVTTTLNLGVLKIAVSAQDLRALRSRFSRSPLYRGPCLLIDRETGLALDSTTEPAAGVRPVLWTPHAAPWQQWRLRSVGTGSVQIISEAAPSLVLTTDLTAGDRSWVWLDPINAGKAQKWRLKTSDDGAAFLLETKESHHALDTGGQADLHRQPILWASHWAAWQQWMICRLPLT